MGKVDDFIAAYAKHLYDVFEKEYPELELIMTTPISPEYANASAKSFEIWYREFCEENGLLPEPMPAFVKMPLPKVNPE